MKNWLHFISLNFLRLLIIVLLSNFFFLLTPQQVSAQNPSLKLSVSQLDNNLKLVITNNGVSRFQGTMTASYYFDGNNRNVAKQSLGTITIDKGRSVTKTIRVAASATAKTVYVTLSTTSTGKTVTSASAQIVRSTPTPTPKPEPNIVISGSFRPDRTLDITLHNQGTGAADFSRGAFTISFFDAAQQGITCCTDRFDADKAFLGGVGAGQTKTYAYSGPIPPDAKFYQMAVSFTVGGSEERYCNDDYCREEKRVPEGEKPKEYNFKTNILPVPSGPTPSAAANLVISGNFRPDRTLDLTLKNQGTAPADLSLGEVKVWFYDANQGGYACCGTTTTLNMLFGPRLDAGKSVTHLFERTISPEAKFYDLEVKSSLQWPSYKTAKLPVPIGPPSTPTLTPTPSNLRPDIILSGSFQPDRKLDITLTNQGTGPANFISGTFTLSFFDAAQQGMSCCTERFDADKFLGLGLGVGQSKTSTYTDAIPSDAKFYQMSLHIAEKSGEGISCADDRCEKEEKASQSKPKEYYFKTAILPVPPLGPDLTIGSLTEENGVVRILVKNEGSSSFSGAVQASYYWDNNATSPTSQDLGNLVIAGGAESPKQMTVTVPMKTSTLHVTLKTAVAEYDTNNNSGRLTILGTNPVADTVREDVLGVSNDLAAAIGGNNVGDDAHVDAVAVAGILPGDIRYGFKDLGRGITEFFTFDPEKKIELREEIINEKILETSVAIDKNSTSDAIVASATDTFKKEEKIAEALDELRKKDEKKADDLTAKIVADRLKRETAIDKLKHHFDVDDVLQVTKAENASLDTLGNLVGKMKDTSKLKSALDSKSESIGSPFKPLKNVAAINQITTHIANENAREILEGAKEKHVVHLKNNLQSLDQKQLEFFKEYVNKTAGDKVTTLKALDDVKTTVNDKNVKAVLGTTKQQTIAKLVKDLKDAKVKDPKAGDVILSDLKKGSMSDLRVLSDLKSNDSIIQNDIQVVKKTAIQNFEKHVNALKPEEKQKFLSDATKDHLDLTQQVVVNDIKKTLPKSSLGKELDNTLKTEVKTKVAKVKGNKAQYDEFLESVSGDTENDKEAITAFTTGFDSSFYKDLMREQLNYMKSFYADADTETKKILDQYYFSNPEIKAFYTDFDSTFDKLFSDMNYEHENEEEYADEESDSTENEPYEEQDAYDAGTTSGCAMIDAPVCGTDGLNYSNKCEANDNGADVAYEGECSEESSIDEEGEGETEEEGDDDEVMGARTKRFYFYSF